MPAIPTTISLNKSTMNKDQFHTWMLDLHAYLTGVIASTGTAADARAQLGLVIGTAPGNVPLVGADVSIVHPGCVSFFAMSVAPAGWLKANGALVSRATYAALFAVIGTTYGAGDGATTFGLPDLRGEFVRGFDDSRGADTGRVFGSTQGTAMMDHAHKSQTAGGGTANLRISTLADGNGAVNDNIDSIIEGVSGGTPTAVENRPRNVAMLACIKY